MATYVTFKLCTFGYLGSVRDHTDGFEPIINGFKLDLNSKWLGHSI